MSTGKKIIYCLLTAVTYIIYAGLCVILFKDLLDVFSQSYTFKVICMVVNLLILDPLLTSVTVNRLMPEPKPVKNPIIPEEL